MRLSEIAPDTLDEGILGNLGKKVLGMPEPQDSIDQRAADSAQKLQAQGYGQQSQPLTASQAIANVQQNSAQQQYIKGLVAQWQQVAPKIAPTQSGVSRTTATPTKVKTAAMPQRSTQPSITIGGKLLTKGGDGLWHGETGAAVTDTAQAAKIDKAYQDQEYRKKQFQQTAIVREAPAEYTTPSGIVVPGGAKTDTAPQTATTGYRDAFVEWAGEKLRTVDPTTRQVITLDQVYKTDVKDELDRAQAQVVATAGDPAKNTVAVNNYLTIAVAGISKISAELRQSGTLKRPVDAVRTGQSGQAIVTQQDIVNKLSQEVGMNTSQIEALKKVVQDPASLRALLKLAGVQA